MGTDILGTGNHHYCDTAMLFAKENVKSGNMPLIHRGNNLCGWKKNDRLLISVPAGL